MYIDVSQSHWARLPQVCHLPWLTWVHPLVGRSVSRSVSACHELLGRRSGSSEIMDRRVGACWVSGADPFRYPRLVSNTHLTPAAATRCACVRTAARNFRVGEHVDQTGKSAAVGGGFEDKNDCRTHQNQLVKNPLDSRDELDGLEWDARCAREAPRPQ